MSKKKHFRLSPWPKTCKKRIFKCSRKARIASQPSLPLKRACECLLEKLFMQDLITEGEYHAGLRFQKLSYKIRRLISAPQLRQIRLEDPHVRTFYEPDDAYDDRSEQQWRQACKALLQGGRRILRLIESVIVDEQAAFKTLQDLKSFKTGLQALEKEFIK